MVIIRTKIISFANQKGGVGKTSLTLHLAGTIAAAGKKILLIDLDPQGNLSSFFIENIYELDHTVREMIIDEVSPQKVIQHTKFNNIDILPSNLELADLDAKLAGVDDAQFLLMESINGLTNKYDYVLIDCPPSLGKGTRMALVASTHYIIPIECQEWATKGAGQLISFVEPVRKRANKNLKLLGFVINKYNNRRRIETEFNELLRATYKELVFKTEFRNAVVYTEAVTARKPINVYASKSQEAKQFENLFMEIENRG